MESPVAAARVVAGACTFCLDRKCRRVRSRKLKGRSLYYPPLSVLLVQCSKASHDVVSEFDD